MDAGSGLDTMGPNISRSLLLWLVLVLPLLADAAVGASGTERTGFTYMKCTQAARIKHLWDCFNIQSIIHSQESTWI